jgi:hypothetical protein
MECRDCGHVWEPEPVKLVEINAKLELVDAVWKKPEKGCLRIDDMLPFDYESKAGNRMLKLSIYGSLNGGGIPKRVYHFLDFEGNGSEYGRTKARMFWRQLDGDEPPPDTVEEALERFDELTIPDEVQVQEDGKYLRVVRF